MTNELQIFNNLKVKEENGQVLFDAESAAIGLGITTFAKSGKNYVRWSRVNDYLDSAKSGRNIQKGDFITEPQFYKLAIKANNETAEYFQNWVTSEVLPAIRRTGGYQLQQSTQLNETLSSFEARIKQLEEANLLSAVEYNYIGKLVSNRVTSIGRDFDFEITPRQRVELNRDLNEGISRIAGVEKRTQLQAKDYEMVVNFIREWEPSTATLMIIKKR